MNSKILETLETLEEKIENIKWMLAASFPLRRNGASPTLNLIRRSAGILGRNFPKGTSFENRARREWKANSFKRSS